MSEESTASAAVGTRSETMASAHGRSYEEVAQDLRQRIRAGVYRRKLPGIRRLSTELSSNPMTVGRAVKLLIADDLLFAIPKSGTYIQRRGFRRTGVVGFVANDVTLPMTAKVLAGVAGAANEKRLKLVLSNYARCPKREAAIIAEAARGGHADGIIWFPSSIEACACARSLFGTMPFIGIGIAYSGMDEFFVSGDPFDGFRALTRHLLECGCRRMGYVTDQPRRRVVETDPRYLGFRSIVEGAGLECGRPLVVPSVNDGDWSKETRAVLLRRIRPYDGLLCTHDRLAAWIYQLLGFGRVRCPEEIALASYDGLDISEALGITTYMQSFEQIGRTAFGNLLRLVASAGGEVRNEMIPGRLVVRQSTCHGHGRIAN